ncbi:MAG TPA: hypothetical protein VF264_02820 [Rhodanobacteraceae bacterium]
MGKTVAMECAALLARATGTHGLLLDAIGVATPRVPGIACWATLRRAPHTDAWYGPLRAELTELPFVDDAFCVVLACGVGGAGGIDGAARELARTLAPHGTLLVADLHPCSLWRGGIAPYRWARALRAAGLSTRPATRCGAPWPRAAGVAGLPAWLTRRLGGAYVIEARRSVLAVLPLRTAAGRRSAEPATLLPGARRQCA